MAATGDMAARALLRTPGLRRCLAVRTEPLTASIGHGHTALPRCGHPGAGRDGGGSRAGTWPARRITSDGDHGQGMVLVRRGPFARPRSHTNPVLMPAPSTGSLAVLKMLTELVTSPVTRSRRVGRSETLRAPRCRESRRRGVSTAGRHANPRAVNLAESQRNAGEGAAGSTPAMDSFDEKGVILHNPT
jgi:hypothetical protein